MNPFRERFKKKRSFKLSNPTVGLMPLLISSLLVLVSLLHSINFISAQKQLLDCLVGIKYQTHICVFCVFCVKLCRYQHLEVGAKSPSNAWFPCTAQSDTNNDLEYFFWLKVRSLQCVWLCVCYLQMVIKSWLRLNF